MTRTGNNEEPFDVDVRIGVTQTPKEIELDLGDGVDSDALSKQIEEALGSETGVLWLTDRKGRRVGVPAAKVAYVEIDGSHEARQVGFGAGIK
jgi:hypothetical protein